MTERRFWQEDVKNKFESEESVDTRRGRPSIVSVVVTPPLGVFLVGLDVLSLRADGRKESGSWIVGLAESAVARVLICVESVSAGDRGCESAVRNVPWRACQWAEAVGERAEEQRLLESVSSVR